MGCSCKLQITWQNEGWKISNHPTGVFGWGKDVMYLASQGHPNEIGIQLGKACYPCRLRWNVFVSSNSSLSFFLPRPSFSSPLLSHLSLYYLFSFSQGDNTEWPTKVDISVNPNTINPIPTWPEVLWFNKLYRENLELTLVLCLRVLIMASGRVEFSSHARYMHS